MTPQPPWWTAGRYRVVVSRQVTEEETISLEMIHSEYADAEREATAFVTTCHQLMVQYNERVVLHHRKQLDALNEQIEQKAAELRGLTEQPPEPEAPLLD